MTVQKIPNPDSQTSARNDSARSVGRWYIGESLGSGGYSWVKKGIDIKTGKFVALKFMKIMPERLSESEHGKVVRTEIEALRSIRHPNVLRLFAYNLKTKYPQHDGSKLPVTLLVLEYAGGGELYDVLYHKSNLPTRISCTYFSQLMSAIEACHTNGVVHRDIKPQNLLLDSKFNLKLADFGLSKLLGEGSESEESYSAAGDDYMCTTYVGTPGYQAPELLLSVPFTKSCDVFSAGVVLFILLNGYPPFNRATKLDQWYKHLATGDPNRFWNKHRKCEIMAREDKDAIDLLSQMLEFDPNERIRVEDVKHHPFFTNRDRSDTYELISELRSRHRTSARCLHREGAQNEELEPRAKKVHRAMAKPQDLPQLREFDSSVDCVRLTDWVTTKPVEEIWPFIEESLSQFARGQTTQMKVEDGCGFIADTVWIGDPDDDEIDPKRVDFQIELLRRSIDERVIIRMTRRTANIFPFYAVQRELESLWHSILDVP